MSSGSDSCGKVIDRFYKPDQIEGCHEVLHVVEPHHRPQIEQLVLSQGCLVKITDCVSANGDDINEMKEHPECREISFSAFRRLLSKQAMKSLLIEHGYESIAGEATFSLKNDWHVCYYISMYCNQPVAYMTHSGIEHIYGVSLP